MGLLKYLWKYLLSVWILAASWTFFLSGYISLIFLLFLWRFRIGKIFLIYPNMGFADFLHLAKVEIFLAMVITGLIGIYFLQWRRKKSFSEISWFG